MILSPEDKAYVDLADAIIVRAVNDYRNALRGVSYNHNPPEIIIKKLEKFFHSKWYRTLTKLNADYLICKLKEEYRENERRKEQLCESN